MRQAVIALLLALTLALGLSGCTDKTKSSTGDNGSGSSKSYNSSSDYGTNDNNGTNYNNGTNNGSNYNGSADHGSVGSDLKEETEDLLRGRSYDEMLRNGRVNDTDGILTDGENHVSR